MLSHVVGYWSGKVWVVIEMEAVTAGDMPRDLKVMEGCGCLLFDFWQ